jgi:hypothetical protein
MELPMNEAYDAQIQHIMQVAEEAPYKGVRTK